MKFFNIDETLKLPQIFNVLHNALDDLYARRDEEFQKSNPLKEIYQTYQLNQFQRSFGSSIGFKQAFEQTVDYAAYPGFNNAEGFRTTVSYKPFSGKVVFTWQTLLEADHAGITQTLSDYQIAWQRQIVQYGMFALTAFFGDKVYDKTSKSFIKILAADTVDGDPMSDVKNPVFSKNHTVVRTEDMSEETFNKYKQSNKFYIDVKLDGSDPLAYAKLANGIYQIKVIMSKYLDDNAQFAGVNGRKKIVLTEDANLNMLLDSILAADNFSCSTGGNQLNPVKGGFDKYSTPYLEGDPDHPMPQFATDPTDGHARGFLMLDPAYNSANKGPMMVERLGFSMKAVKTDEPEGIKYLAKQAFDFCCPSWRGIAYVYIGKPGESGNGKWNDIQTYTEIKPIAYAKPVTIVGEVTTNTAGA